MPSLKKMRDIRREQRLAAGKESPLNPRPLKPVKGSKKPLSTMDKGKQKRALERSKVGKVTSPKPTGIRKVTKATQKIAAAKKAAAATPTPTSTPKPTSNKAMQQQRNLGKSAHIQRFWQSHYN